jgi:S1-C subfamily serine protease
MAKRHVFSPIARTCAVAALMIGLGGCATAGSAVRAPELAHLQENSAATYRIDILPAGHGSGTVISTEGHILTAAHVVVNDDDGKVERKIQIVIDEDGKSMPTTYPATVVALDKKEDLAVVKVERRFANPVILEDERNLHAGDRVYNVGYPYAFGDMIGRGYVAKMHYTLKTGKGVDIDDGLVMDIPDGPGTSGCGVFAESSGRLVGVMRLMFWVQHGPVPPMVVKVATPVSHVRRFLDANKIPYVTADPPS